MNQFYDTTILMMFILVICVFMWCFQKRTERIKERNAKLFEMRAASARNCVLEYEDIDSSEMDNDNNDDIDLIEQQKALKHRMYRNRVRKQPLNKRAVINILSTDNDDNDDNKSEEKTDVDVFSDSTDDGMSMARMREEYYKSQTLTKRFTDLLEDIRDVIKLKHMQVQRKFIKKKPTIVVPMAIPSRKSKKLEDIQEMDEEETDDHVSHSVDSESDEKVIED